MFVVPVSSGFFGMGGRTALAAYPKTSLEALPMFSAELAAPFTLAFGLVFNIVSWLVTGTVVSGTSTDQGSLSPVTPAAAETGLAGFFIPAGTGLRAPDTAPPKSAAAAATAAAGHFFLFGVTILGLFCLFAIIIFSLDEFL